MPFGDEGYECVLNEQIELQAKLLNYFLGSNKSNINQCKGMSAHLRKRVKGCIGSCESECGLRRRAHHELQHVDFDECVCV